MGVDSCNDGYNATLYMLDDYVSQDVSTPIEFNGRHFKLFGIIKDCNLKITVQHEPETINFETSIKDII